MSEKQPLILIIEDEASVRGSLVSYLNDSGLRNIAASDGKEGLAMFVRERPELVLLDLRLPGLDGMDVLKAIRKVSTHAAVIVVSGKGLMHDAIDSLRLGAWDYITKPIHDLAVLDHAVRRALERIKLLRENEQYRDHLEEEVHKRTAQLDNANRALEAKNTALHEVLTSIGAESKKVGQQVHKNVERVILPQLRALNSGLSRQQQRAVEQIQHELEEIVSPFIDTVSRHVASLTPTELRVCSFIKRGLAVKEIAELEHLSPETVAAHRRNIRRKLGIANKKVNLTTYLQTVFSHVEAKAR
jgi:DNA-binding NarL/FixJ family response regulator